MNRSHLTQELLNYFDATDTRVRQYPNTLDAQLLNSVAGPMEEHQVRVGREVNGRLLRRCPLNIDNRGMYYKVQIPMAFPLRSDAEGNLLPPDKVIGRDGGASIELQPMNDLFPVPQEAVLDPDRVRIPFSGPRVATLVITPESPLPSAQIGKLPIPNSLTFWLQGMPEGNVVTVLVEGHTYPKDLWTETSSWKQETVLLTEEGPANTKSIWESVSRVQVFGLPSSARLDVYCLEMNLPFAPDPARPYTHPDYRDTPYRRFWRVAEGQLEEVYYRNADIGFAGPEPPPLIASYATDAPLASVTVEPNTSGLVAVRDSLTPGAAPMRYYLDRREPLPEKLDRAALTVEPRYGLKVTFDDRIRNGDARILDVGEPNRQIPEMGKLAQMAIFWILYILKLVGYTRTLK